MSRARAIGALTLVLIGALVCLASSNEEFHRQQQQQQQSVHITSTAQVSIRARLMQSVLDFAQYKRLFHKTYGSLVEELARQKYYLSRAFRALVSSIKYKYRRLTYFLRVNDLSDQSPAELELMENKVLAGELINSSLFYNQVNETTTATQLPAEFKLNERMVDIEADIERFIESDSDVQHELLGGSSKRRYKRETSAQKEPLVSGPYEQMNFYNTKKKILLEENVVLHHEDNLKDVIYFDHRQSGCLFEPRRQGKCGGCYAFAMIAYMEWLNCKLSGQLVALSEQYLIDCGHQRVGNLDGCQGGGHFSIGEFVLNFGLELRSNYPYRMREDQCPYKQQLKLTQTGHLRMGANFNLGSMVPMSAWSEYLRYGPMIVSLITKHTNFNEYGGGIYDGSACNSPDTPSNHMMLLVGHGREEGQDYWLIRNSYSVGWGEEGYYKLAKSADCIRPAKGFMYGTRDGGKTFSGDARPSKNLSNDQSFVRRHYATNMAADLAKWQV